MTFNSLNNVATAIGALKNAFDLAKGVLAALPVSTKTEEIQVQINSAEHAPKKSNAELAKALGYHLCECTFPSQPMLWNEREKAHVCPNPSCGRRITSRLRRPRNRNAMAI
jgi:hypothetical protein